MKNPLRDRVYLVLVTAPESGMTLREILCDVWPERTDDPHGTGAINAVLFHFEKRGIIEKISSHPARWRLIQR